MNLRTLLFFLIIIPVMFIGMSGALVVSIFERTGDSFARLASWWGRFSARVFGIAIEVIGAENYRTDRNYLVISNHAGMADIPLLLGAMRLNLRFVAKEELGRIPVFGWALKRSGYVMIKRGQNREALKSLLAAADVLKNGRSVHIFPEGTRSETGDLLPFKRGAFLVAQKGGAPLLPVTIIGSNLITPKKSLRINRGKVRIVIGTPLEPARFSTVEALMEASRREIETNLDRYGSSQN
ncbi:MAG: 1-acyl-sn-glycerol-3-phosphate acyltransferase [Chlorobium sp.]|uniref:lysophospholipid acyltransferase family protein n=1 Tax=Chlorobium sp. TaxID=1095 RepID=UPI0025B80746|nr:lysophospholipid acyltransferase family protein [Chlorobium sp.]MCF8383240.1 1-acyl-sn-glycerol-3-phosphate acyltransferase [Chlorobium sp.]